jgi:hypothetical protein
MSEFWAKVSERHGMLTTQEGVGEFGRRGFYRRVADGQFELVHRSVWRVAGSRVTRRQALLGVTLALGAVAGFRSTLALARVPGYTLAHYDVIRMMAGSSNRNLGDLTDKVTVHRSNFLPDHHVTVIDSIPTTTVVRALCDVSAIVSLERLGKLVDTCKRLELIAYDDLAQCREDIRARGRRRTTYLDEVLSDRIAGWVMGDSPPEDVVRKWLEDAGYEPVAQHWVVARGRRRCLDIALPDDRVAVEYQGLAAHSTASAVINDSEKITDLQLAGWFVVLVTKKTTRYEFLENVRQAIRIQRGEPL